MRPFFSGVPITDVAFQWEGFKAHVKANNPNMSLQHVRRYLTRVLNYSVERGYIQGFRKLKLDAGEIKKVTPRAFEFSEVEMVFNKTPDLTGHKFKAHTLRKQRLMIRLTLECGLRPPQEIRLLKKEYVDFNRGVISIPAEIVKTRASRTIPVGEELLTELKAWCDHHSNSPWVFPMRGNPEKPSTRSDKTWQRLKHSLGLRVRRYWLRHSHATAALEGGLDAVLVARDMGTSPEMLSKVYVRPSKETVARRVELVRKKYGGAF
jgi:integrase